MLTLSIVQEILPIPKDGPHFGGHLLWVGIHPKVQMQFLHLLQTIQWTGLFSKVAWIHFHLIRAKFFHETPRSLLARTAKKQWAIFLLQSHPREHLQSAFVRKMNKKDFVLFRSQSSSLFQTASYTSFVRSMNQQISSNEKKKKKKKTFRSFIVFGLYF